MQGPVMIALASMNAHAKMGIQEITVNKTLTNVSHNHANIKVYVRITMVALSVSALLDTAVHFAKSMLICVTLFHAPPVPRVSI